MTQDGTAQEPEEIGGARKATIFGLKGMPIAGIAKRPEQAAAPKLDGTLRTGIDPLIAAGHLQASDHSRAAGNPESHRNNASFREALETGTDDKTESPDSASLDTRRTDTGAATAIGFAVSLDRPRRM